MNKKNNTHNTPQRTKVHKHINTQRIICFDIELKTLPYRIHTTNPGNQARTTTHTLYLKIITVTPLFSYHEFETIM